MTEQSKIKKKKASLILKMSGLMTLLISIYLFFMRRDIIFEILNGRDLDQINVGDIILPAFLMILSIFLFYKSK